MALMLVQELKSVHHPRVEATARMLRNFAHDVNAIAQPREFAARGDGKDRDFAVFAFVTVLHDERRFSLVKARAPAHRGGPHLVSIEI